MIPLVLASALANEPPGAYREVRIEGWTLKVEARLVREQPRLWSAVRQEATRQLQGVARVVPDAPLAKLRQVILWVHATSPETACMAYHPGAQWLREHKMNPEMAKGIEIGNARNFVSWTYEQPWMILHELAHAYHERFLPSGFENPEVRAAFDAAMAAKRYESVRHWSGDMRRHYAANNPMEYFAEGSETYFGTNDFFPFVRAELQNADPEGYALMRKLWGEPQKRVPKG